jgi:glucose/arabinose dehydrogenase
MYINDVGQNTWEEVDLGVAGANYGWPNTEGPFDAAMFPNFTHPLFLYHQFYGSVSVPLLLNGNGYTGSAITGGAFYVPGHITFPQGYVGDYFFCDVVSGWIKRFDPVDRTVRNFATSVAAPVDLRVGGDGALYYLSRNADGGQSGRVFRVQYGVPCRGDVADHNGWVSVADLLFILANWGPVSVENEADITGNGVVNSADLMVVLEGWGLCP